MSRKTNAIPKSDQTARHKQASSQKAGKHSSVEKLAASRPEFSDSPGAHPKPGASGDEGEEREPTPEGTNAHRDKALRPKP